MRSLNIIVSVVVSSFALACGSSTPPAEAPAEPAATDVPAETTAPAADAGAPAAQ